MKTKSLIWAAVITLVSLTTACTGNKGWTVEGNVNGGAGQKIALQGFNNSNWYTIDSIAIGQNGQFKYTAAQAATFPEVLRLSLNGASIYFPIDSVDKITINADAANFGSSYSLSGSESARRMFTVDSLIATTIAEKGEKVAVTDSLLKRRLTELAINDDQTITAYYIINKRIAGKPLFNPEVNRDLSIIGAVAQNFATNRPEDPRGETLKKIFLQQKAVNNPSLVSNTEIAVPESGLVADIISYDNKGQKHSLFDVASQGKVVLLSFTSYELENSPAYNVILADLYNKYHDRGLEIFQVAFDSDEVSWKQSAVNLPWIAVWNSPENGAQNMVNYNVNILPLTYIIDRNGDLCKRVTDPTTLATEVAKRI